MNNTSPQRVLVTGPVRSGKSRHAESLLAGLEVDYIAPGYIPDSMKDPEWAERVRNHQAQRPSTWRTVETSDLAAAIAASAGPVLIDCLGTWLTSRIDHLGGWDRPAAEWRKEIFTQLEAALAAMREHDDAVITVTNEVGWSVVPEHASGRVFRDLLGTINQRWAEACDEVRLVVAGRVLTL